MKQILFVKRSKFQTPRWGRELFRFFKCTDRQTEQMTLFGETSVKLHCEFLSGFKDSAPYSGGTWFSTRRWWSLILANHGHHVMTSQMFVFLSPSTKLLSKSLWARSSIGRSIVSALLKYGNSPWWNQPNSTHFQQRTV